MILWIKNETAFFLRSIFKWENCKIDLINWNKCQSQRVLKYEYAKIEVFDFNFKQWIDHWKL